MFFKRYFSIIEKNDPLFLLKLITMGLVSGISGIVLVAVINKVIGLDPTNKTFYPNLFIGFLAVLSLHFIVQSAYQISLIRLSHKMVWKIRKMTLDNVRHADFLKYNNFGSNKVHAILTRDAYELSQFSQMISSVIVAAVTLITGMIYLVVVTPIGAVITLVLTIIITTIHLVRHKKIDTKVNEARIVEEEYTRNFLGVLDGLKEIKISNKKSNDLFNNHVIKSGDLAQRLWATVSIKYYVNGVLGNILFYIFISLFLFIFPLLKISLLSNSFEYILLVLYLMGPAQTIVNSIPSFAQVSKALKRFSELKQLEESKEITIEEAIELSSQPSRISFQNLTFGFDAANGEDKFSIGPLNFHLSKGEIVFLSGGNGSGKSTLIRLLTGLYAPSSGTISINNTQITNTQVDAYRSMFSVIYTDNYIGETILGFEENKDQEMNAILSDIGMSSKVKCVNNSFTTTDLSFGQKKRLSLAVALLEDKPIYVFDETVANQDPEFKDYFYRDILADLKKRGKIIFVVTHDEKYFNLADTHYKMEAGKIRIHEDYTVLQN
jgi:putative pyoverdin transport system ATP-binding/permease protein